jgi:hypothetical protein
MTYQQLLISKQFPAALVNEQGSSCLLVNADQNNTIYLGDADSILPADPNRTTPLGPNASVVVDGSTDTYAICAGNQTALLNIIPGGVNFFLPVVSLTIPFGATTGARITLDGIRGAIFVYDTAGDLIGSIAATGGTNDGFGNPYQPGVVSYTDSTDWIQLLGGNLQMMLASETSPAVLSQAILTSGQLAPTDNTGEVEVLSESQAALVFGNPSLFVNGALQSFSPFVMNNNPIYGNDINPQSVGLGAWVNRPSWPPFTVQRVSSPPGGMWVRGSISKSTNVANGEVIATFGSGFQPVTPQDIQCSQWTGTAVPNAGLSLEVGVNGQVKLFGIGTVGTLGITFCQLINITQ